MGDVNVKKTAEILGVGLTEKQEAAAEGIDVIIRNGIGEGYSRVVELAFLTQAIRKELVPIMVWDPRIVARPNGQRMAAKMIAANAVKMTEGTELAGRFQVCGVHKDHIVYSRRGFSETIVFGGNRSAEWSDMVVPGLSAPVSSESLRLHILKTRESTHQKQIYFDMKVGCPKTLEPPSEE